MVSLWFVLNLSKFSELTIDINQFKHEYGRIEEHALKCAKSAGTQLEHEKVTKNSFQYKSFYRNWYVKLSTKKDSKVLKFKETTLVLNVTRYMKLIWNDVSWYASAVHNFTGCCLIFNWKVYITYLDVLEKSKVKAEF